MPITPIKSSTQDHLDIEDIRDDITIFKDGSAAMILQTSSVNFDLLSEEEQDSTIYAYASLLNSLTFPIQILIRSQKKDVTGYLKLLENQETKQTNPLLKQQISTYKNFVNKIVKEGNVLDKKFYIIIPYSYLELGISKTVKRGFGKKKKSSHHLPKEYIVKKALTSLKPKRDHLYRQFNRIGLKVNQLKTEEIIKLFFSIYNPDNKNTQQFSTAKGYSTPLVQAAMEKTTTQPSSNQPLQK